MNKTALHLFPSNKMHGSDAETKKSANEKMIARIFALDIALLLSISVITPNYTLRYQNKCQVSNCLCQFNFLLYLKQKERIIIPSKYRILLCAEWASNNVTGKRSCLMSHMQSVPSCPPVATI